MKKGITIVEVMVSIAIFSMVMLIAASTYSFVANIKREEIEYIRFESICLDIDKYYSKFNKNWDKEYYSLENRLDSNIIYYDYDFNVTDNSENKVFELEYHYSNSHELIINITKNSSKTIISNLNYGGNRYEEI